MKRDQVKELLLQSLEHERGGVKVYETALQCAVQEDLKAEWEHYLEQTQNHVQTLTAVCNALKIDPEEQSPGARILRKMGAALVAAMQEAHSGGNPEAAQVVACECVVLAETKDHLKWGVDRRGGKEGQGRHREGLTSRF